MNRAEKVLKEIESQVDKYPIIIGPERGIILDEVVLEHGPLNVLEVGTLVGYSAIRMGRLLSPRGRIICVEVDPKIAKVAAQFISKAGLEDRISIRVGPAQSVIPRLKGPFDLVFLDAEKSEYLEYLHLVEGKMKPGGVVVADNIRSHPKELRNYLDYVRKSGRYSSTNKESMSDSVEVSVRK
ncbi:MAG TPA: class I SAM-dependent methyltransferase [Nitrososphaerales archaeon]|nr:class I SAM-dependent methyltransferase [Nitrososphaerales archaeon]